MAFPQNLLHSLFQNPKIIPSARNCFATLFVCGLLFSNGAFAQADTLSSQRLKAMSLEELMNIEVTSVSKHSEKLQEAASAIQVITREDIIRSGARTVPEALRLAPNLQVAQVNASQWAISARGFNNVLANKLLVLIDGRTVYTPMYAGVFWDVQNLMLEDIERIEVISGPGGTMWGANAVNGVINIITKNARDTPGFLIEAAHGTTMPLQAGLRYGGKIGEKFSYRVFASGFRMESVLDTLGNDAGDRWSMAQGGFRADWTPTDKDRISIVANGYIGTPNPDGTDSTGLETRGDNILMRWNRQVSGQIDLQLQAYYDHTLRDFGNGFAEDLKTYDIEWQNRHSLTARHVLTYGLGARLMDHEVTNLELFGFFPGEETLELYNGFVQYDFLLNQKWRLTLGSKLEYNNYTKFQHQPNARLAFMPNDQNTLWAAASRAVRNPSRIDRDFMVQLAPGVPLIQGNKQFDSESVMAYELGWRAKMIEKMTLAVSTFYNRYDNLRSAEPGPEPFGIPITFGNGVEGIAYGAEFSFSGKFLNRLNLRGGYTIFNKELEVKPGSADLNAASAESNDPKHQIVLQSGYELPHNFEIGAVYRYVDELPQPYLQPYHELDMRIAWRTSEVVELSLVGQNLLQKSHPEFIAETPRRNVTRSVYAKITCRF